MSSPDDRPREPEDEAAAHDQQPPQDTESRLEHVDPEEHLTPQDVKQDRHQGN